MPEPVYVTNVAERTRDWSWKHVILPTKAPPQEMDMITLVEWDEKTNGWRRNFSVQKDRLEEAKKIAGQLWDLGSNPDQEQELEILKKLMELREKGYNEKTNVEKWAHMAVQLPEDIGGPNKKIIKQILTERAQGRVLEAMCGFNSYLGEAPNISEVVAMDYCTEMLERYPYPERTRILYDLEKVVNGEQIDFFPDESFQTIVMCFGSNYLSEPVLVFKEFRRILSPQGKLLIVDSTTQGYSDIVKRYFKPEECSRFMEQAGFVPRVVHLPIKEKWEMGKYFLVEGTKP